MGHQELFESHRHVAREAARRFYARTRRFGGVQADELENAALVGLWDAARRYKPASGVRFATFARPRIGGEMIDWLRAADHLPRSLRQLHPEARQGSLDATLPVGMCTERCLGDAIPAQESVPLVDLRDLLATIRQCLGWRSRVLLRLIYNECLTQREIAEILGLSQTYIAVQHMAILQLLRESLAAHGTP